MNNVYKYSTYEEIPVSVESYIISVADVKKLEQVPLEDINSFLMDWKSMIKVCLQ